jgi:hypothetical protein
LWSDYCCKSDGSVWPKEEKLSGSLKIPFIISRTHGRSSIHYNIHNAPPSRGSLGRTFSGVQETLDKLDKKKRRRSDVVMLWRMRTMEGGMYEE